MNNRHDVTGVIAIIEDVFRTRNNCYRKVYIDTEEENSQRIKLQVSGDKRCTVLNNFQVGDKVKAHFSISGDRNRENLINNNNIFFISKI